MVKQEFWHFTSVPLVRCQCPIPYDGIIRINHYVDMLIVLNFLVKKIKPHRMNFG